MTPDHPISLTGCISSLSKSVLFVSARIQRRHRLDVVVREIDDELLEATSMGSLSTLVRVCMACIAVRTDIQEVEGSIPFGSTIIQMYNS